MSPAGDPVGSALGPLAHFALLLPLPRATEEAEKTTTSYLDNGARPAQGEEPCQACRRPSVRPPPAPPPGRLTICVCLSPPPDWAQLESDSSLFP